MQSFVPPGYVTFFHAAQRALRELGGPNDRPHSAMVFMRRAAYCGAPPTYFFRDDSGKPAPMESGRWLNDIFYREASCGRKAYYLHRGSVGVFKHEGRAFFRSDDVDRLIAWARSQREPLQITDSLDWKEVQEATAASAGSGALIESEASPVSLDDDLEGWLAAGDDDRTEAAIELAIGGGGVDEAPQLPRAEYLSEREIRKEWNLPDALFDERRAAILHAVTRRKLPMQVWENGALRSATTAELDCLSTHSQTAPIDARFRFERIGLCKLPSLGLPPDEAKRQLADVQRAQRERALAAAEAKRKTANDRARRHAELYEARTVRKQTMHDWALKNAERALKELGGPIDAKRLATDAERLRKDVAKGLELLADRQNQTVQPAKPDGPAD